MDWLPNIFRRRQLYDDLSEEVRLHLEERAEQLMREGISPEDAAREARRAFGNRTLLEERSREVWQWPTLESIWADVRFALRQLRKSPGFICAALVTLALAIGANAVVFGILNALFLRPLSVPHPESLYAIERGPDKSGAVSYPSFIMPLGHLKAGVTPAQAIADLNSVGSHLEKSYPKDDAHMTFSLARPSLAGDALGPPAQGFVTGLMLLSGLILLAACANLGSLFAARAADRSREVALRLALGASRKRILRAVFTEAVLISLVGGGVGLLGSIALLRALSVWRPIPMYPIYVPVTADANVYWVALLLALASGFLFGAVPVRQILRTNPYEVVKAGSSGIVQGYTGRRITARVVLLVAQIAICAVLVTSSLVAVRGLLQSMHTNFGFDPQNAMLVDTNLTMDGYNEDRAPEMQRRMIRALETIPGVKAVGFVHVAPLSGGYSSDSVFTDETTDLRSVNAAADAKMYRISP